MRPLIFMDKEGIIDASRKTGLSTFSREVGGCGLRPEDPAISSGNEVQRILLDFLNQDEKDLEEVAQESEVIYL